MAASEAELREALQWETGQSPPDDKSVWEWLWEAIQGDFNDNRSTGQIAFDAAVSMVPLVDQVCDVRDLIANCHGISTAEEGQDNTWKWVALALTLIGLIPTLGSALKGVLKIFFTFVRRYGIDKLDSAVDDALGWVITYLRKPEVQAYLKAKQVDEVFKWLADGVRGVKGMVNSATLLSAFDRGIGLLKSLTAKATWLPAVGERIQRTLAMVERVRAMAPQPLQRVDDLLQRILGTIALKLDMQATLVRSGILDARNVHFRGGLPEARAVTLMRTAEPPPAWLSKGRGGPWKPQSLSDGRAEVSKLRARDPDYPQLSDTNIASFHRMVAMEIKGPAKLYRVVSPSNGAMGDCWIPEDVWNKVMDSPDPKAAWRRHLAVWPDWNANGQFVVMEIPAGQSVKAWRGPTASQTKDAKDNLDAHLEGGWDQVVLKVQPGQYDTTRIYRLGGGQGNQLRRTEMTYQDYSRLPADQKAQYAPIRERINHPGIRGPLDTGWGSTDFGPQMNDARIGLPTLPGQVTN
jgi:hypothetical protein